MHIHIEWQQPIQLTRHRKALVSEDDLPDKIKGKPGVYFFSRRFGSKFEPAQSNVASQLHQRSKEFIAALYRTTSGPTDEASAALKLNQ
jgi:hypothetical protein